MYKKIFLDTNPIIYLLQDQKPYSEIVKTFLIDGMKNSSEFYTTTITDAEFMVKPFLDGNTEDIETYKSFLNKLGVLKTFISDSLAEKSAKLRAKYPGIKLADALQLAASIDAGCDAFLTNDIQLTQVTEANVVYLGNLK